MSPCSDKKSEDPKKKKSSGLPLSSKLLPDQLELFGAQIVFLGGVAKAIAGVLLLTANLIAARSNRLAIIDTLIKEEESKEDKNKKETEKQLEGLLQELDEKAKTLKEQISYMEGFIREHWYI